MSAVPAADDRPHVMRCHFGLDFGGIESMMLRQVPRLNAGGYRMSVCLLRREGALAADLRRQGVPVHLVKTVGRLNPGSILRLSRFLREQRVSIAHAHSRSVYVPVTIAARMAGIPVIIGSVHEMHSIGSRRRAWQERLLDRWRTAMVTVSDEVADDYCRTTGISRDKCVTIYNGIDAAACAPGPLSRDAVRATLGLPQDALVVITIGRLQPQKAHEILVSAAASLLSRHRSLPVRFVVVGEGPRKDELAGLCEAAGVADRFLFLGARRDVPDLLRAADVTCLTSRYEGFSNVVLESLVMGVPVVSTDAGGVREAIEDGRCGYIVPVGDAAGVADRLARLLSDPAARREFGERARLRGQMFSLEANIAATRSLYDRLLAAAGSAANATA
jgi:glycosyltransferase involved in cell wall biosynthesis